MRPGYEHEGPPPRFATNLHPASIVGLPDRPIEDVVVRDITIVYGGGAERTRAEVLLAALHSVREHRSNYPEFSMFGELPAWALFVRDARGVRIENVSFQLAAPDFRSALVAERIAGFVLDSVTFGAGSGEPVVVFANVTEDSLQQITWSEDVRETVRRLPASPASTQ